MNYDITIVGAGLVGLATAYQLLQRDPTLKLAVIDKETSVGKHQSGHNSNVIHSGVYYPPDSLKAINCLRGYRMMLEYCDAHDLPYELCGKVIVATEEAELPLLQAIYERGVANGLEGLRRLKSNQEIQEYEPNVEGIAAIHVKQSGIISYPKVAQQLRHDIERMGGTFYLGEPVEHLDLATNEVTVRTPRQQIKTKQLINCAGLYADRLAEMSGEQIDFKILPFRGEYYELRPEKRQLVKGLIYPVPNPAFPFLGVHFTKMVDGRVEAGPNAVLAYRREGYTNRQVHMGELAETLFYPGFRKLATAYWRDGLRELQRSYSKAAFVKALRKLMPSVQSDDLVKGGAGVRAQAVRPDGSMVEDFLMLQNERVLNVCNAPSPAATSCLSIGETIASRLF